MIRIIDHIRCLLLTHDCVIVPGFGGFVLRTVPSSYAPISHTLYPSRKEIVFNATLRHNDGLLAESYMRKLQVDYTSAQSMIENDVTELGLLLEKDKDLLLDNFGHFKTGYEGQLIFNPDQQAFFHPQSYGLPVFPMIPLFQLSSKQMRNGIRIDKRQRGDIYYIPISRKFVRAMVATAAAITLFFMISTPIKKANDSTYAASVIPTKIVSPSISNKTVEKANEVSVGNRSEYVETIPDFPKAQTEVTALPRIVGSKTYYIVIASLPNKETAKQYIGKLDKSVSENAGVIERDKKYRVYTEKFGDRDKAQSYLNSLRSNPNYNDAWMYISK